MNSGLTENLSIVSFFSDKNAKQLLVLASELLRLAAFLILKNLSLILDCWTKHAI